VIFDRVVTKQQILFLAANPAGTVALRLDEEARAIQEELQRATQRDQFAFVTRMAARPLDLLRALRDVKPTIIHFAGHAESDGIYLAGEDGLLARVTRETLLATFGAAGQSVQIVVLNGCSTERLAEALCEFVPVCVGTSEAIGDDAARVFSIGFYGALAAGESAARACLHGNAAMRLAADSNFDQPHLRHRRDVNPGTLVLADGQGAGSPAPAGSRAPAVHVVSRSPAAVSADRAITAPATPAVTRSAGGTDLIAPLVLLQLSDLHFGPHGRFAGCDLERLAAQCRQALDEARDDLGWREAVGLVLVTGDIAEAARPPEYAAAATFFLALARELALSSHRFVFVPGNHDISWTRCREVEGQLDDGAFPASELRARLDDVKLAHFEKFLCDVHGGQARHEVDGAAVTSLGHGVFVHDFADLGVSVAALNSCERESHRKADHVGMLSAAQAQAVLDHWRTTAAGLIRVAAVHHNPATMAPAAIEDWLTFLRTSGAPLPADVVDRIEADFVGLQGHEHLRHLASDAHVSLILHGHHHASMSHQGWAWRGRDPGGAGDVRIVSAGSWGLSPESGKLPKDQPVVMQLIRLDPAAAQLHAVLLTYEPDAHLPGEVRPGRFLLDAQTRADRPINLSLPPSLRGRFRAEVARDRVPEVGPDSRPRPRAPEVAAAVAAYRTRKAGSFERWDLRTAGPQPTVSNRPVEITLDEMYIPLRFAAEQDPSRFDRGAPIMSDDLLQPRRPQVVIGGAGSGKTTWMRWTFRRLIRDPRAMPFFLELRAIAAAWKTPQDAGRAVDLYLIDELTACGVSDPGAMVAALLVDPSGPRLVLLIDGWDELGAQGERLRERLVEFCSAFPRVVVVVSSRPYGDTRPAGAEGFETLHIQALSDDDIRLLTTRFHHRVHGLDEAAGSHATGEFMTALAAVPDARSLAGTTLLLTMMLLLSREGPLPDRRHKLYNACLRNMLLHRVTQRERDGAVVALDQWRPDDSEERLRVVAELAYRMQTEGYKKLRRAPMIRAWDAALDLLRADWSRDQRDRFLRWLVASAGVLIDRSDGSVQFAHLSFQEHLAAYYLFITREGDERVAAVRAHIGARDWWETLRLWAGLTGDQWPDKLSPVFEVLRADGDAYWLAGQIFADGTGQPSDFDAWAAELPAHLSDPFAWGDDCAQAWRACKQSERRVALATSLSSARGSLHWLAGTWHAHWCDLAHLEVAPAPALLVLEAPIASAGEVARSRVLFGGAASWPDGGELAVLRLWPSARGAVGVRLQAAISLGAQTSEVVALLPALWAQATRSWSGEDRASAKALVRYFGRYFGRYFVRDLGRYFGRYFVRDLGRYLVRDFGRNFGRDLGWDFVRHLGRNFGRDLGRDFGRYLVRGLGRDFLRDFGRYFVRDFVRYLGRDLGRDFVRDLVQDFGRYFGLSEPLLTAPWLPTFAILEVGSVAERAAPRAALAHSKVPDGVPLLALFRVACQASFAPGDGALRAAAVHACNAFEGDSLWPALARHVARISRTEDRVLLEDLARHPEQRAPPLSWGLQHYVRGDLVFDDGSVVTLDELCDQAGLAPLPLLEAMPDELDLSLEAGSP
jgi:hypothetical protein